MITPDYARLLARYNRWQNRSLYAAADGIGEEARRLDLVFLTNWIEGHLHAGNEPPPHLPPGLFIRCQTVREALSKQAAGPAPARV